MTPAGPVILLGLGFTTRRLARRFLARGIPAYAAVRKPERYSGLTARGLQAGELRTGSFPQEALLIHTVPPLPEVENVALRERIVELAPRRIVYISSTGVYGSQTEVDDTTATLGSDEKARVRIADEEWLEAGPWSTLIVRPAAIYGPGRGVHIRILEGRMPRGEAGGVTSRIHVDDLAAVLEAGTLSDLTGAFPLADDYPCSSAEIAEWFAGVAGINLSASWREPIPVWGRRVDGRRIRELLGVRLQYPRYDVGIQACLNEEKTGPS